MVPPTEQELIQLVRRYYPTGSFVAADSYTQQVPPYTATPEHQQWLAAWKKAMAWTQWDTLLEELESTLGGVGDVTQPYMAACRRCVTSGKTLLPGGSQRITRVAAAVSVLAPLYVTYVTTETVGPHQESSSPQFSFEPTADVELQATTLARTIERVLDCRPFPLPLAHVSVPGIFVSHLGGERATLLHALFDHRLQELP